MGITEQRQQLVLGELRRDGRVSVKDLAKRLGISTETVRRDLRDLEMQGHARRVYGGAVTDRKEADQPFDERLRVSARDKARIAQVALPLIEDGMTIFVDTGTTTLAFARLLVGRRVSIHTNSVAIAALLSSDPVADVVVLGGFLKPDYKGLYGHRTLQGIREHVYDLAVMGIVTVHIQHGFMDIGQEEAALRRAAVEQAGRSVILADGSKFGRLGTVRTFGFSEIQTLVTNAAPPPDFAQAFQQSNVDVLHA
ncbi:MULTISPECIES: DeoR/GlpR family DNA-binding transcription regulator [unclassified Aureimonas]|uniref:DeoR/GlpR family DNA-binding transcription regulator n=1 Tax=unclassified Aureimonas TaxID=2615206 RepID=UPI0006FBA11B|nr:MULTISPECIES: DeoR/GlpR family DNA-binding transcription regulator [unclassified Aureimonas]KQT52497.1 DeoR family transcriptional regulator [Aureimonas sp. Leaf427]KQT77602.1 DeoR family transcriptional regulator [Aureimonas sp. Leaf460]